ncbi:MAG: D-aminoacyl-tRNA deacylase [Burkholderiaceae bacterium]
MIALIQRVTRAAVRIEGETVGAIGPGLLALVCAERGDTSTEAQRLAIKLANYRVFSDEAGRMNRSLLDVGGGLLAVSQFTLAADTNSGTRPSFTPAAPPAEGQRRFDEFVEGSRKLVPEIQTGCFGAEMQIELVNDGPVTFWLQVKPKINPAE